MKSEIKKRLKKEFKKVEKSSPTYVNPWGIYGGLFISALLVFMLLTAYTTGGIDKIDLIIISILALTGGGLHSLTISSLNTATTQQDMVMATLKQSVDALKLATEKIAKLKKEIKTLRGNNSDG